MKISNKLSLGFLLLLFVVISVFYSVGVYTQNRILRSYISVKADDIEPLFNQMIEHDTRTLASTLEVVTQDPAFKELYLEKDRDKLFHHGQPLFQKLKKQYGITHFYFILPNGQCFLRLHNRDIYDDEITRHTFWNARETESFASGIELGKTAFALRVVAPYYSGEELIGYVELGQEIDHFLMMIREHIGGEHTVFAHKELLDKDKWRSLRSVAELRNNWDDLDEHLILSETTSQKRDIECFKEEMLDEVKKGRSIGSKIKNGGKDYICEGFALKDAAGNNVGAVLSLIDITDYVSDMYRLNISSLLFSLIIFIAASIIIIFISESITRPLSLLKEAVLKIEKGDLDVKVTSTSKDETGQLARAFNSMSDKLKTSLENIALKNEELNALSITDELTGLYNRRGFNNLAKQQLKIAKRQKQKLFLLYIDLDRFKAINDNFGHDEGDTAIKDIARILKETYRESDIIGRLGGDEFVVFPIGTGEESIKIIIARLENSIDIHNKNSNKSYNLSISFGISSYDPGSPCDLDELLTKADRLMYEHKRLKKSMLYENSSS